MDLRDRALELARTGDYVNARDVIWAMFKNGYARAPGAFGYLERRRITQVCKATRSSTPAAGMVDETVGGAGSADGAEPLGKFPRFLGIARRRHPQPGDLVG